MSAAPPQVLKMPREEVRSSASTLGSVASAVANDQPLSPMGAAMISALSGKGIVDQPVDEAAFASGSGAVVVQGEDASAKGVTFDPANEAPHVAQARGDSMGGRKGSATNSNRFSKLMGRKNSKNAGVATSTESPGPEERTVGERTKTWSSLIKRTNSESLGALGSEPSHESSAGTDTAGATGMGEPAKSWQRKNTQLKRDMSKLSAEQRQRTPRSILEMRREPSLHMAPYGQFWSMDAFSLPHNAIRRELLDCYIILYAMDVRRLELSSKDIATFFQWWTVFVKFFDVFLDAEDDVIYPWVGSAVKLTGLLEPKKRAKIKDHLRMILGLLTNAEQKLIQMVDGGGEPIFLIKRALDKISLLTQEYFVAQERVIPRLLNSVYTLKDKRAMDRRFINYLLKSDQAGFNVVLVSRWLQPDVRQPKPLLEWRYDNLGPLNWTRYGVWYKQLEAKHTRIMAFFRAKRDAYIEEEKYKKALFKSDPAEYERKYGPISPVNEPATVGELVQPEDVAAVAEEEAAARSATASAADEIANGAEPAVVTDVVGETPVAEGAEAPAVAESGVQAPVAEGEGAASGAAAAAGVAAGAATAAAVAAATTSDGETVATNAAGESGAPVVGESPPAPAAGAAPAPALAETKEGDKIPLSPQIEPERVAKLDGALASYEKRMSSGLHMDNDSVSLKTDDYADSVVLDDALSLVNNEPEKSTKRSSSADAAIPESVVKEFTAPAGPGKPQRASSSAIPAVASKAAAPQGKRPTPPTATAKYTPPVELERILANADANEMDLEDFLDADDDRASVVSGSMVSSSRRTSSLSQVDYGNVW